MFFAAIMVVAVFFCTWGTTLVSADCQVKTGPTSIFEGMATGEKDLTISNGKIAFSLAVDSNNYWNMTKGSILDIGICGRGGTPGDSGVDLVNDVEFLNDLWTSTGIYNGTDLRTDISVDVTKNTAEEVIITVHTRYWVADADKNGTDDATQYGTPQQPLNVTLTYTLKNDTNYITLGAVVENPAANAVTYKKMYSGFSESTLAASMYGPHGYYPDVKVTGIGIGRNADVNEYFGNFVTTYGSDYAVSLEMDNANAYKGSSGYKDIYTLQDLTPGNTYQFNGEVLVSDQAETATVIDRYITRDSIAANDYATIGGTVKDKDGNPVAGAYVIAEKQGQYKKVTGEVVANMQPFVWDITDENGQYSFRLPKSTFNDGLGSSIGADHYKYKFKLEAAGYTSTLSGLVNVTGDNNAQDFTLEPGVPVTLKAVDELGFKIPFKVNISGVVSEIKTLGGTTFFSDALDQENPYTISFNMTKANNVTFTATYGANYESVAKKFKTDVTDKSF